MIKAEIISIGNELLSGITINSNASWIARELADIGINVCRITTISDKKEEILSALKTATLRADIILCTGGLGPTPDDITKKSICNYFRTKLMLHQPSLKNVIQIFKRRKINMPEINRSQAMVPEKAQVIPNKLGTAPGLVFYRKNKFYGFMPGVPQEMKAMLCKKMLKIIKKKFNIKPVMTHLFRTTGIAESALYEKLSHSLQKFPDIQVAFLPRFTGVDLRLSINPKIQSAAAKLAGLITSCREMINPYIYTEKDEELEEIIGKLLIKHSLTLAVAESFTGGYIADRITDIAGSSAYFLGSVVTYSNESKIKLLKVNKKTLEKYGAVSKKTVQEMALGVQKLFECNCAIATTGIAGPTGATKTKPIGLCFIAAACGNKLIALEFNFSKDRLINKERGAAAGLELLRRLLLNIEDK